MAWYIFNLECPFYNTVLKHQIWHSGLFCITDNKFFKPYIYVLPVFHKVNENIKEQREVNNLNPFIFKALVTFSTLKH